MANDWGRKETLIWPPHVPIWSYSAVVTAVLFTCLAVWQCFHYSLPTLQRSYFKDYLRLEAGAMWNQHGIYRLIYVGGAKKTPRVALPGDFKDGITVMPSGNRVAMILAAPATSQGFRFFYLGPPLRYADAALAHWFEGVIFAKYPLLPTFSPGLVEGFFGLIFLLSFAVRFDAERFRSMKYGRRLKGPMMLTPKQFNKTVKGTGIGFKTAEMKDLMRVPMRNEAQHFLLMGDTGTGKTTLIKQILRQIQDREDSAIVYDPACEYIRQFYNKDRGDIVLNPLDVRCPYWGPAEEMRNNAEADAIAASLYQPTNEGKSEFFTQTPAQIFAHLLKQAPSPQDIAAWLADAAEIEKRVKGTEMEHYIGQKAGPQRAGVLSSLGLVAKSFRLLPTKEQAGGKVWSATNWSRHRQGWIFITSRPAEREALRPLHSLWIDLLVMRLLSKPERGQKQVWFVIDELASLQRLPQLHTAITENRKSKNPLVLGLQGKAQPEVIYGRLAETMLSQPATKLFMRTTEPKAAEWVSNAIGKVEIERVKETKFDGSRSGKNFTVDRQIEPLVMDSEIEGLSDMHAYLKLGNNVARFDFEYLDMPPTTQDFIPRRVKENELGFDLQTLQPKQPTDEVEAAPAQEERTPISSVASRPEPIPPAAEKQEGEVTAAPAETEHPAEGTRPAEDASPASSDDPAADKDDDAQIEENRQGIGY